MADEEFKECPDSKVACSCKDGGDSYKSICQDEVCSIFVTILKHMRLLVCVCARKCAYCEQACMCTLACACAHTCERVGLHVCAHTVAYERIAC